MPGRLAQPFRLLLGAAELAARTGLGPRADSLIGQPEAKRQATRPPFWMTRPGDRTIATRDVSFPARDGHPLRVRLYRPAVAGAGAPVLLYLHGGGWVLGGLDACDYLVRRLVARTGLVAASLEYRIAPEATFPVPLHDCEDAVAWLGDTAPDGVDGTRIAVAGDSAGGNLSAALALSLRDQGVPALRHQTLFYPLVDATCALPSWRTYGSAVVNLEVAARMVPLYAGDQPPDHPLISPLHATDLTGLPPATVVTAEVDVLHDEGEAYARRLAEAGVPVRYYTYAGMPHGFLGMPRLCRDADIALDLAGTDLLAALGLPTV